MLYICIHQSIQDALIDVVVGLGAPVHKLIMTVPAFGNSFNLADAARNLPGSAVTGQPTTITYQQVGEARGIINLKSRIVLKRMIKR